MFARIFSARVLWAEHFSLVVCIYVVGPVHDPRSVGCSARLQWLWYGRPMVSVCIVGPLSVYVVRGLWTWSVYVVRGPCTVRGPWSVGCSARLQGLWYGRPMVSVRIVGPLSVYVVRGLWTWSVYVVRGPCTVRGPWSVGCSARLHGLWYGRPMVSVCIVVCERSPCTWSVVRVLYVVRGPSAAVRAYKDCGTDGRWWRSPHNNSWSNYTACVNLDDLRVRGTNPPLNTPFCEPTLPKTRTPTRQNLDLEIK